MKKLDYTLPADMPSRRRFLSLMSASLALAGLSSCRKPVEKILPYVKGVEESIPGIPVPFATTMPLGLDPAGVLVSTFDGRPTKIEGLPGHPASLGASDIYMQAAILNLYDQDRSRIVLHEGKKSGWDAFTAAWREQLPLLQGRQGEGLAVLAESASSPTFRRLQKEMLALFPRMKWVNYDSVSDETCLSAARIACGVDARPLVLLDKAEVILALDADLLYSESGHLRHARAFAAGRTLAAPEAGMNRLYVVEPGMTLTGGAADHRFRLEAARIAPWAWALAAELGRLGLSAFAGFTSAAPLSEAGQRWVKAVAKDLMTHRGRSVLTAGRRQPVELHLLLFAINLELGNVGSTLLFAPMEHVLPSSVAGLKSLTGEMAAGRISHLAMLGGNPLYTAPADLDFAGALAKTGFTLHLSDRADETSAHVVWHLPENHFLEQWGDAASAEGRLSALQPMIEPLFGGRSAIEIAAFLAGGEERSGYELVRESWRRILPAAGFEHHWRMLLHSGIYPGSAPAPVEPDPGAMMAHLRGFTPLTAPESELEICFQTSAVYDGRWANNAWLQELPDPVTKITWDNPARISRTLAHSKGLVNGDLVHLQVDGREISLPVWIVPGQADHSVTLELGYGRTHAGRVGNGVGFDVGKVRSFAGMGFKRGLDLRHAGGRHIIACAQEYDGMAERPLVREATLTEYRRDPYFARHESEIAAKNLWKEHEYAAGYQWGMVIDLTACIGCNACTIACQSENNIPVVGKEQVAMGREMHWIRLDRYFKGEPDDPEMVHQPVACQHCENAPCEQVCPVAATVHDHEGLNVMAYNRCVGTRYCSNNCPYKARRFNFFDYTGKMDDLKKMAQNPDVTVRMRGVMEKCTYCLQRLTLAKNKAKLEGRTLADGEAITACQQACPTGAITFGNLLDGASRAAVAREWARTYALLGELNVRPRTLYAAKIRNRNPELSW